jgi:type I restriction enzyme S subunit
MSEWKECSLSDIVTFQRGHDLTQTDFVKGIYPVAGSNGIIDYHNKYTTKGPGLTLGRSGNSIGVAHYYEMDFWAHNTTLYSKEFKNSFPKYVYYLLKTIDFSSFNTGSAVPSLNRNHIHRFAIKAPPLPEQRAIASVLSSLDDKIELLHRQNKTLEAMAETLFRQWFVEEVDERWDEGKLCDIVSIKYGKDHKKLMDGTIPAYGSGGIMRYVDTALYTKESVLIPRKGTLNNVVYIDEPFWTVDTMFYTEMKIANAAKFVFHLVNSKDLASMNVGSAVPSMTTDLLNNMPISIPDSKILSMFETTTTPLSIKLKSNRKQIRTLVKLRDVLLPKLISGEVQVKLEGIRR